MDYGYFWCLEIKMFIHYYFIAAPKTSKKKKSKSDSAVSATTLQHSFLCHGHHNALVASMAFLSTMFANGEVSQSLREVKMLLVGLGGGALPLFISKCLHNVSPLLIVYTYIANFR